MAKKFEIFVSNVKDITESNAKRISPSSYLLGLNQFADWSPSELQDTYLHEELAMPHDSGMNLSDYDLPCKAPPSLDWRLKGAVTEVKRQLQCGSCWAFSVVATIEGANAIATGKLISLSEQELMDCGFTNRPCKGGGSVPKAFYWVVRNGGLASEKDYPYIARKGTCKASKIRKSATIKGYCPIAQSDNGLMCATVKHPISIRFNAVNDFFKYKS